MFRKVVVGTDGSETAELAVAHAAALAGRAGAELFVVHAYRPATQPAGMPLGSGEDYAADDVGRSLLEHAEARHGGSLTVRTVLREGHPADVLLDVAEDEEADLIAVGDVGMAGARRFLLGSVPDNVSHQAPCSVLIVHTAWGRRAGQRELTEGIPLYRDVLVGTDGSEPAAYAVGLAAEVARGVGADLVLVYVGDEAAGEEALARTAETVGNELKVDRVVVQGDPAERIVETAEERDCDLIVVGNRGMRGARRFLGSVPNSVSHHAGRNVLIAKTT